MISVERITPNLWFDYQAEQAARYYVSIFSNSAMGRITHYPREGFAVHKRPEGSVLTVEFELEGQTFIALNGGPLFKFNEAVSFIVSCDTQQEIDYYWDRLSAGGDPSVQQCGWLKDKFGVSWQVVPSELFDMMADKDHAKVGSVMAAYLPMKKLNLAELRRVYVGERELSMAEES